MFNFINKNISYRDKVVSMCCGEKIYSNTDICSKCMEHSDYKVLDENEKVLTGIAQLDDVLSNGIPVDQYFSLYSFTNKEGEF